MQLNEIALTNFGPYLGRHEMDLRPASDDKPIILFGGKNGAGKTSLFEAVRLCLYGINALPGRTRRVDYEQFLADRIHRKAAAEDEPADATVEIEFEYAHHSKIATYRIRRSWSKRANRTTESLQILRDGELLTDVEDNHWQDFIKELIPLGLSRLFFFDGEKIEDLASDTEQSERFRDSLRSLLGLELVERLQTDLAIHISRQEKKADRDDVLKRQKDAIAEHQELDAAWTKCVKSLSQLNNELDRLRSEIQGQENKVAAEGGTFAARRQELKDAAQHVESQIEELEESARVLAAGLLPFALAPNYVTILQNRLLHEAELSQAQAAHQILDERKADALKRLGDKGFWDGIQVAQDAQSAVLERVTAILDELAPSVPEDAQILHPCGEQERAKLLSWINQALTDVPTALRENSRRLEELHARRKEIESHLKRAPAEEVLAPLMEKLNKLNRELGEGEGRQRRLEDEKRILEFKLDAVKRRLKDIDETLAKAEKVSDTISVAARTRQALDAYLERITKVKLDELSQTLAEMFSELSNKPGYYERVEIDPETFATSLYNKDGKLVSREQLSAGERQMFAISLLWALARTSGRPLPFIIDTPLGRLDHAHRANLVKKFFPHAAHQVIILSTDSEIEGQYYEILEPYISRSFTLTYDAQSGESSVNREYKFAQQKLAVVS